MKLTGNNSTYDQASGAFLVHQSDEMKLLMQISKRLTAIEAKLDTVLQGRQEGGNDGTDMGNE